MKVKTVFVKLVVLLISSKSTFQQFAGCRESYFLQEGSCTSCPDRCAACISELNCTQCNSNFYGPVCQYTCQQDCEDLCHKVHGYCTYGCEDGFFPEPDSPLCAHCPAQCTICKTMTDCAECLPGYYGNICEKRCSSYCKKCNKTTGACLVCDEGYFNQDGHCRRCPDGCENCSDNKKCSRCENGYLKLSLGQCIMECSMETADDVLNTIASEYITSKACTNTTESQYIEVQTRKPCIQYTPCSSNIICHSKPDGKSGCGTLKTYQCSHECHLTKDKDCMFVHNCTIIEQTLYSMSFCFTSKETFSFTSMSIESECSHVPENAPIATPRSWIVPMGFQITQSVVLLLVSVSLLLVIIRYRKLLASGRNDVNDKGPIKDEAVAMIHRKSEASAAEPDFKHPLQDILEKDGSDSDDATIDSLNIDVRLSNVSVEPNAKICFQGQMGKTASLTSTEYDLHS